jgi:cation:H+ antiporter
VSGALGVVVLVVGTGLVVAAADAFVDGLLGVARSLKLAPFVLSVLVSGFETENLVAGIVADLRGLPDAAAGTFLGGITFLALGVAGLGGLIAPADVRLPARFALWTALAPLPLLAVAVDGRISRPEGALLVVWALVALVGLACSGGPPPAVEEERARHPASRLLGGLAVLSGGGWLLGEGLRATVQQLGVSQALLGNTALAATVEAEELARFTAPSRRGRPEIGFASVAGTLVHFAGLNAGVIALVKPLVLNGATTSYYLPAAAASPALLAALLLARRRLGRPEGASLAALYAAYVGIAIAISA